MIKPRDLLIRILILALGIVQSALAAPVEIPAWQPHDFDFTSTASYDNPFTVDFSAEVTGPDGIKFTQLGFYDGQQTWRIRLGPNIPGKWSIRTISSDSQLNGRQVSDVVCVEQKNPRIHGRLLIDPEHPLHFVREDGTRFFYSGFECDWLWAIDLARRDARLPQSSVLLDKLVANDFNLVYMNIYAHTSFGTPEQRPHFGPPALYAFGGTNDKPDHSVLNLPFWQHYDRVVQALLDRGIEAHVMIKVYNKHVKWPRNGSPEDDRYFKYALARYAAFCNVHWDLSKESNKERSLTYKLDRMALIRKYDPYRRLLTTHTDQEEYPHYRGILDYRTDQNHKNWYATALKQRQGESWPIVNSEYGYECGPGGPEDKTAPQAQDAITVCKRAWEVYMAGAYGAYYYTYAAWDVVRVNDTPPGYAYFKNLARFFSQVGFWLMEPDDSVVSSGHCLVNPGVEYVAYQPEKQEFMLKIEGAAGRMPVRWFNPLTGDSIRAPDVENGKLRCVPPSDWAEGPVVFHVGTASPQQGVFRSTLSRPLPTLHQ